MEFQFSEKMEGRVVVVEIPKYLSADISEEFKEFLYEIVGKGKHQIVIDLSQAEYVDSSGLGAIVSRLAYCRALNGDIRLAAPSEFMVSLLNITHLDKVLKVYPDTHSAVSSFAH